MQWFSKECQQPFYAQLLMQEGCGQWGNVERKCKQRFFCRVI
jgi:hypothetical protein